MAKFRQIFFKIVFYLQAFFPALLWAGLIFVLSNQEVLPGFEVSLFDFLFKKLAHMFVYAVLFYLFDQAFNKIKIKKTNYLAALFITMLYSLTDEYHQSFIPGRTATLRDIGYDFLGILIIILKKFNYI